MNKTKLFPAIIAVLILSVTSCAMKQEIFLDPDGSGRVDFDIKLAPYFTEVVTQLSDLIPDEDRKRMADGQFFDLAKIRNDFSKRSGVRLESLESSTPEKLTGSFYFSDINTAVTDAGKTKNPGIFSFKKDGGVSRLSVRISIDTIGELLRQNPSLNSPLMENFGPLANQDLSESDYLDMMEYMLGEESRQGIMDSRVDITVKVKGRIISQTGGIQSGSSVVKFSIPLIKILVLKEPLDYSVSFK